MSEGCVKGTKNEEKIKALSDRVKSLETTCADIFEKISDIQTRLLSRPGWTTTVIITVLSSTTVGLLVAHLGGN